MSMTADWLRSFKLGLALGLTGKPLPFAVGQSVEAILENGKLYIKKAPAVMVGSKLSLSRADL